VGFLHALKYPVAIIGTIAVIVLAWVIHALGRKYIDSHVDDPKEHYRKLSFLSTTILILALAAIIILWARPMQHTGTFLGLIGAGVAVALRDPLLSVAGRIAIFAGNMYSVGDRIEINKMTGDVIDVGFFYTRMMEVGHWIGADQVTGRLVQFSNSRVFGHAVFNYTQNFAYIWDVVTLPITYSSNVQDTSKALLEVGNEYTREFLKGARSQLEDMRRYFLVPEFELEPQVYLTVTSNWIELTMRYVVDPKKRRSASSFIYTEVFKRIQGREDIVIASETMDLSIHPPGTSEPEEGKKRQPQMAGSDEIKNRALAQMRQQDEEDKQNKGKEEERAKGKRPADKKRPAA